MTSPIFSIDPVEFQPQRPVVQAIVASHKMIMGLDNGQICIIDLQKASPPDYIEVIPSSTMGINPMMIRRFFLDPTGRHLIVGTRSMDYYYIFLPVWKKAKVLTKFKGLFITCIAWGPIPYGLEMETYDINSNCSLECLVATANGLVFETVLEPTDEYFKKEEKYFKQVYSISASGHDGDKYITDIHYEYFLPRGANPANGPRLYFVILATRDRLSQFVGRQPLIYPPATTPIFESVFNFGFQAHQEFLAAFKDGFDVNSVDNEILTSNVSLYAPFACGDTDFVVNTFDCNGKRVYPFLNSKSFSWLTMAGIYHATLVSSYEALVQKSDHNIIEESKLIPYTSKELFSPSSFPTFIVQTEFHVLLLQKNHVSAICLLNADFVYEETVNTANSILGLIRDPVKQSCWLFCKDHLYEILVSDEDRMIWKIYLDKQQFDLAASYSKTLEQKNDVLMAQARYYFDTQKYLLSATYYAQTSASVEKVSLLFYDLKEHEALKIYLLSKIFTFPSETESVQMTLLCTWLLLVYLQWLTSLRDGRMEKSEEEESVQEELYDLFKSPYFKNNAHRPTVFRLINTYDRIEEFVEYAVIVGEIERVIDHHLVKGSYGEAVKILDKHGDNEQIYKYSTKLIEKIPKDFFEVLHKRKGELNPKHLLPALLKYTSSIQRGVLSENHAVSYLEFCIFSQKCRDPVIHNYLISLYAQFGEENETKLVSFIKGQEAFRFFDVQYALRICMQYKRNSACIYLNGILGNYEDAVDLALKTNDMTAARLYAGKPDDVGVVKKLWLKIAKHMIASQCPTKEVVELLYATSEIKFEDLLALLPEGLWLEDFRDEIVKSLEGTQCEIESLRREMDAATVNAELIRKDLEVLKKRSFVIAPHAKCSLCDDALFSGEAFYVFPCKHYLHTDCLMQYMKRWCSSRAIKRAEDLQKRIVSMSGKALEPNAEQNLVLYREELDSIIAHECLLCGDRMIESIDMGFIDYELEQNEIQSWVL